MSIIGGILNRRGPFVPDDIKGELLAALSRKPDDVPEILESGPCVLAKIDVGAYGAPAFFRSPGGGGAVLAGYPGLTGSVVGDRNGQLSEFVRRLEREDEKALEHADGTFCAAHYARATGVLRLITDKVGVRGLYYWANHEIVVFASALRIIERLSCVQRSLDVRGVAETIAFGHPLGDRTPYRGVKRLLPGEVILISKSAISRSRYWRWEDVAVSSEAKPELPANTRQAFLRAVESRAQNDTSTVAFLSGGLDSRIIVAALRELKKRVVTVNLSMADSLDQVLARSFAEACGTQHLEGLWIRGDHPIPSYVRLLSSETRAPFAAERSRLIWSGDGGSVGLGLVYVNPGTVEALKKGDDQQACRLLMADLGAAIPTKFLTPHLRSDMAAAPMEGLCEELAAVQHSDPVRRLHILLMNTDQRWHLFSTFENVDLNRIEMHLPFFDGAFLTAVMGVPPEWCLQHRFYNEMLPLFLPEVTRVPWQAYPGHEKCPLPLPSGPTYQWSAEQLTKRSAINKQYILDEARRQLARFPGAIFSASRYRTALLLFRLGIRDYGYLFEVVSRVAPLWEASGSPARVTSPSQPDDAAEKEPARGVAVR